MLILQNNNLVSVFFGALFLAFAERAFWLPLHYAYPFNIKQKEQEYALINAIAYLAPFLSPLLGLFIVDNFGYNNLFLAALLIYCLVFVFFFFLKPFKFDHIKIKPYFKFEPLYVADAFKINILGLIWPAFLLLSKWPLENIIFLFSACYFISGLTSLFNASYLKPEQRKALSTYAALLHSMSIITRIITNPVSTAIAALIGYTSNVIFDAHYMAYFYHRAKLNISEVFSRELNIAFTYFVIFLFSLVLPLYTDFTYLILMLITASGSFYVFKFFRNNEFKG
jgi:hypothetical protein